MTNPTGISRLRAIFAHPDDEAFGCGGLMAALTDQGIPVTLVSATRGEAGEILHGLLVEVMGVAGDGGGASAFP